MAARIDALEPEADGVADAVLALPAPNNSAGINDVLASPGQTAQHDTDQRFRHTFSRVRVHSSAADERSARDTGEMAYPEGPNAQRQSKSTDNPYAQMPLEEAVRNLPRMSAEQALAVLKRYDRFIVDAINSGEERIRALIEQRAESFGNYLIGGAIETFGGASLPSDHWDDSWQQLIAARRLVGKGRVRAGLLQLLLAAGSARGHWIKLDEYLEDTDKGADRSIFALQGLEAAGAVAAVALTGGGAAGIAAGAGYSATQNLVGQATSVSIGLQDRIDWGGVAFDTLFGALTGALGGKLGNLVLQRLLVNKATASLGRQVLSEIVTDLISGRVASVLQTSARMLFDQLRGREDLTVEQFMERLVDHLTDPKAMFLDTVMGRASKMAHSAASKPSDESSSRARSGDAGFLAEPFARASEATHPTGENGAATLRETPSTPAFQDHRSLEKTNDASSSGLELDRSGNREDWNRHIDEYQVQDPAKLSVPPKRPGFGEASTEKGGTEHHTGIAFHEYSAAEVAIRLRVDWDPVAARPRKVSYQFTARAAAVPSQASDRSFHQESRLKGESTQSKEKAYVKSGLERGHLAQREAGKVDADVDAALGLKTPTGPEVERSLDVLTNVVPMTPTLNKGQAWRSAERRTAEFAARDGYVTVEIRPEYDATPQRLSDGTPIPGRIVRTIVSGKTGDVLESLAFSGKTGEILESISLEKQ